MKTAKPSANNLIDKFEKLYQRQIRMPSDLKAIAQMQKLIVMPWSEVCKPTPDLLGILVYKSGKFFIGLNDLPTVSQSWRNFIIAKAIGDRLMNLSMFQKYLADDLKMQTYFDIVKKPVKHAQKLHQASLRFALELLMPAKKFALDWSIHLSNPDVYTLEDIAQKYNTLTQAVAARAQYELPS